MPYSDSAQNRDQVTHDLRRHPDRSDDAPKIVGLSWHACLDLAGCSRFCFWQGQLWCWG